MDEAEVMPIRQDPVNLDVTVDCSARLVPAGRRRLDDPSYGR